MKLYRALFMIAAGVFLTGCVVRSLNPFFAEADFVPYPDAVGAWVQEDGKHTWTFKEGEKGYEVTQVDENNHEAVFRARFGKIGTNVFINLFLEDPKFDDRINFPAVAHLIPAHTVAKVAREGSTLVFVPLDHEWTKKQLEKNPKLVQHIIQDDVPIFTAPTTELRDFLRKYGNDTNAFNDTITLKRK